MNKNIIFSFIVVIILALVMWQVGGKTAALPVASQLEKGSQLVSETGPYDFGTISMKDGVVKTSYVVTNPTDGNIRIDSLVTSCMCTTAYLVDGENRKGPYGMPGHSGTVPRINEVIEAGGRRTVEVIFDPAAHGPLGAGSVERYIYLVDEEGGALELEFKAQVTL